MHFLGERSQLDFYLCCLFHIFGSGIVGITKEEVPTVFGSGSKCGILCTSSAQDLDDANPTVELLESYPRRNDVVGKVLCFTYIKKSRVLIVVRLFPIVFYMILSRKSNWLAR